MIPFDLPLVAALAVGEFYRETAFAALLLLKQEKAKWRVQEYLEGRLL